MKTLVKIAFTFTVLFCIANLYFWPANKYEWMRESDPWMILPIDENAGVRAAFVAAPIVLSLLFLFHAKTKAARAAVLACAAALLAWWAVKFRP